MCIHVSAPRVRVSARSVRVSARALRVSARALRVSARAFACVRARVCVCPRARCVCPRARLRVSARAFACVRARVAFYFLNEMRFTEKFNPTAILELLIGFSCFVYIYIFAFLNMLPRSAVFPVILFLQTPYGIN